MLMTSHSGTGVITIQVDVMNNGQQLVVDFISSELTTPKEINLAIKNLVILKDLRSIIRVEQVEPYLKVAKILTNKLGWMLEFDFHKDYKFRLCIPLNMSSLSGPNEECPNEDVSIINKIIDRPLRPPGTSHRPRGPRVLN
jgi:hypothetical protein